MSTLPKNVHVSNHPCLRAKLSQLRSKSTPSKDVKALVHDISLIVGCEALASAITTASGPKVSPSRDSGPSLRREAVISQIVVEKDQTPLGFEYETTTIQPQTLSIVPILRSGLGMVDAVQTLLPDPVAVHHLGLYREPSTLEPVEYYNNLPEHITAGSGAAAAEGSAAPSSLAIIVDPVIATGGTCAAAIQTLREWGAQRILVLSVLGAQPGLARAAGEWPEGVEIYVAGLDEELTAGGMLKPGLGDVGDRLFLTIGK